MSFFISGLEFKVQKISQLNLDVRGNANLMFGENIFLVGFQNSPDFHLYERDQSGQYNLVWQKNIPDDFHFECWKCYLSPCREIFLKYHYKEVCVYDCNLHRIKKQSTPGQMRGLITGAPYAVMDNLCSPSVEADGLRLNVAPTTNQHHVVASLEVPTAEAYSTRNVVRGMWPC